jgi:alkyl hydroperoxide reductase subunit AhpC
MGIQLGDIVPDFEQQSTTGTIRFHDYIKDGWAILFSHPKDFTPVCTTELGAVAKLSKEWKKRNVKVIALSVDATPDHEKWQRDIEDTQGVKLDYPILADHDRKVSNLYGMIHPNANDSQTVRTVYIVDPNKKLRLTLTYPASTGRNFDEILRVIDSLQLTDQHKVATPVNWKRGDDVVILPALQDADEIARRFPKGFKAIRPWLRITPDPSV